MKKAYLIFLSLLSIGAFAQTPINTNGGFETGDATGWTLPGGGVGYVISADAANAGSNGLHVNIADPSRLDGLVTSGFQLEIGKTYTVEMMVYMKNLLDDVVGRHIPMRLMPASGWSDGFKDNMTLKDVTGWGQMAVKNQWTKVTYTKEITTAFLAGSNVGDLVDSKLHMQASAAGNLEFYLDDVKIYEGLPTDVSTVATPASSIYSVGQTIYINGVDKSNAIFKVYNLMGALVYEGLVNSPSFTATLNVPKGIYIVSIDGFSAKVSIN